MADAARPLLPTQDSAAMKEALAADIARCSTLDALEEIRVAVLGKKGSLTELMKQLGALDPEARKTRGAELNQLKNDITVLLDARKTELGRAALDARLISEKIDVTLSPRPVSAGRIHPISQTIDEIITIFAEMGFTLAEGPEIESDFNNFTALNIPPDHPARQMQDTFYLPDRKTATGTEPVILRTQTSPVQVRTMLNTKPPIRIIAPGRTYRCDYDQTHTPMFHQVEGLVIDDVTTMAQLKGCLMDFLRAFFQIPDLPARFRPSYFPFVEPGAEMDIGCSRKDGAMKLGNHGDWLEILGCGMVHPQVLRNCGIDPDKYQGFAFGMGIERIAMLKYGIPDLRTFFEADCRWLKHYGFSLLETPSLAMGAAR
jgi:phenylalanyl-tRNA synthetase alpha chain